MTEHTKIPLPGDPHGEPSGNPGGSLFERAAGAFGLGSFTPAPMPPQLDRPSAKRSTRDRRPDRQPLPTADVQDDAVPSPVHAGASSQIAAPSAPVQPVVRFGGQQHTIDRLRLREHSIIVPEEGASELLEEFRIVKRQLLASAHEDGGDERSRRVLVCSPHPGEGKTFCAINLAVAMAAERDSEVLLVDADFAKPSVLSTLGLPKGAGLMDALADPAIEVENLVLKTDIAGLYVLPAGSQSGTDSEWLSSARTAEVLDRLTKGAPGRMVIFDSPPALAASPAAELAKHVGQAVLVCRADRTGSSALEDAVHLLGACPDIKLLLNAAHFSPSGRKFGSYYGYEG